MITANHKPYLANGRQIQIEENDPQQTWLTYPAGKFMHIEFILQDFKRLPIGNCNEATDLYKSENGHNPALFKPSNSYETNLL